MTSAARRLYTEADLDVIDTDEQRTAGPGEVALEPFDAVELEVARLFGDLAAAPKAPGT